MFDKQLNQQQLDSLYSWVDNLPLSRSKKNISRDFSDGVLMAEAIAYYFPKLVELHNYPATNSIKSKIANWKTLNAKVLGKLGLSVREDQCQKLASSTPMMIQTLLYQLKKQCGQNHRQQQRQQGSYNQANNSSPSKKHNLMLDDFEGFDMSRQQNPKNRTKPKQEVRGLQANKVEELREILKMLKEKISFVEKTISRKDMEIKELEEIIHLGL